MKTRPLIPIVFLWALIVAATVPAPRAAMAAQDPAAVMHTRFAGVAEKLNDNPFGQPIHLISSKKEDHTAVELSAVIDFPFHSVSDTIRKAENWCEIMMLHFNVKYCAAAQNCGDKELTVFLGRKHEQPLESAHRGSYRYRVITDKPDYFQVLLDSAKGPFQTRNYRIMFEAVPLTPCQTFIHFSYSYDFGALARAAQSLYFHTMGREKVGFTIIENGPDGEAVFIGGVRGAIERNIMRYYLALKAYLGALDTPPPKQLERRLQDWFAMTERYPLQLRELSWDEYFRMKQREHRRRETSFDAVSPAGPSW